MNQDHARNCVHGPVLNLVYLYIKGLNKGPEALCPFHSVPVELNHATASFSGIKKLIHQLYDDLFITSNKKK